jgi:hypothetical protein
MERATGIEPVLPAWESKLTLFIFNPYKTAQEKYVHALHTVHAVPVCVYYWGTFGGRLREVSTN